MGRYDSPENLKLLLLQQMFRQPKKAVEVIIAHKLDITMRRRIHLFDNTNMTVVLPDQPSLHLYLLGTFEPEIFEFMKETLKPGDSFFDVGAHFGHNTLSANHIVGAEGKIVALEPTPRTNKVLTENCHPYPNILISNKAVDRSAGAELEIKDLGWKYGGSNSTGAPRLPAKDERYVRRANTVQAITTTIDQIVENTGIQPSLIKLDCEGCEMRALQGATQTIYQIKPAIAFETGDLSRDKTNDTNACISFLQFLGYSMFEFNDGLIKPHKRQSIYNNNGNLLALPD